MNKAAGYLPRLVETEIERSMKVMGAVSLEGPKACGKTWCARHLCKSEFSLVDPTGNFSNRKYAEIDPMLALEGEQPHLIDEWQDVPKIWDAVRYSIDSDGGKGKYILCGSSSVDKSSISHSGSERISPIRMHTMSLFESKESDGKVSLDGLFRGEISTKRAKEHSLKELSAMIVRGGWPGMLEADPDAVSTELHRYLLNACSIDAQKIDGRKRNVQGLMRTIRSLARNESTLANQSTIAKDTGEFYGDPLSIPTVEDYLNVLSRLFLTEDQFAFSPQFRSSLRVGKNLKRHLADPSLSVAALGLNTTSLMEDPNTFGFMFEALCERDLRIYAQYHGGSLFHYRDYKDREVDAILEIPGRGWGAFEIKLGSNQEDAAAEALLSMRDMMVRNEAKKLPEFLCVICGTGDVAYRRDDGVFVVPITSLGP